MSTTRFERNPIGSLKFDHDGKDAQCDGFGQNYNTRVCSGKQCTRFLLQTIRIKKKKKTLSYGMKSVVSARRNLIAFFSCVLHFIQTRRPRRHERCNYTDDRSGRPDDRIGTMPRSELKKNFESTIMFKKRHFYVFFFSNF